MCSINMWCQIILLNLHNIGLNKNSYKYQCRPNMTYEPGLYSLVFSKCALLLADLEVQYTVAPWPVSYGRQVTYKFVVQFYVRV